MRYYSLEIATTSGQVFQVQNNGLGFTTTAAGQGATFSSIYTPYQMSSPQLIGQPNPNALNLEIDLPIAPLHTPQGNALIRVWGLGIECLVQAANLNPVGTQFNSFVLKAGMSKGLPLANAAQANVIAQGQVYQAFGNWQGTEQTLDLIIQPGFGATNNGVSVIFNWQKGAALASALQQTFQQAFPTYAQNINIASLVATSTQGGCYRNVFAFAKWLNAYTARLGAQSEGAGYPGVSIITIGNAIYAFDGAGPVPAKTVPLAFQDLVGQPTWIDVNTILFPTVMRGDINYGDTVTFPKGILLPYALTSPAAAYPNSPAASSLTFSGNFAVNEIHCYGNYRAPDAASWNTTYKGIYVPGTPADSDTPTLSTSGLA